MLIDRQNRMHISINYKKRYFSKTHRLIVIRLLASVALVMSAPLFAQSAIEGEKATVYKAARGINASLVDHGDYYLRPDGSKITFYRKKDIYTLKRNRSVNKRSSGVPAMQRFKTQFGERVQAITNHRLGFTQVVRIDNSAAMKAKTKQAFDVAPRMLSAMDSSITSLEPVLANSRGSGDIALTNKLLLKLENTDEPQAAIDKLASRYQFVVQNKLRVSGNVYSVVLKSDSNTIEEKFALVRRIMREGSVKWSQPVFNSKPYKTSFEPSDPLFTEQWHLRNTGIKGSRCDTDCDANNAWDIGGANGAGDVTGGVEGDRIVIAILDDGVQLDHEDLRIWENPDEPANDADGFIGDTNGWDFVDDGLIDGLNENADIDACTDAINANASFDGIIDGVRCRCAGDGNSGPDNDPSPHADAACVTFNGDDFIQDNHGTAVAGIAAAIQGNGNGGVGVAFNAEILPIRLVSDFDGNSDFCARAAEAIAYAGRYADVISNSWATDANCTPLEESIADVVAGSLASDSGNNISKRQQGSPVIFASGNEASGWVKVTAPVSAGEHAYEWRFLSRDFLSAQPGVDDTVWLDDITWPGSSSIDVDFESPSDLAMFTNACDLNICDSGLCNPDFGFSGCSLWSLNTDGDFSRSGNNSAQSQVASNSTACTYTYLHTIREEASAGEVSFWVWVSANPQENPFEFLIDGVEVASFGDTDLVGTLNDFVNNNIAYPANLDTTIAVGSSGSGDLSGSTSVSLEAEQRSPYSQFGGALDLVAPSSDQHLGIVTTDRYGNGQGFDSGGRYTNSFTGTSASAPIVAGVAAAMIAVTPDLTAEQVRGFLRSSADKIGLQDYVGGRNDFHGFGRVNMFRAIVGSSSLTGNLTGQVCAPEQFGYRFQTDLLLPDLAPSLPFCAALGPLPVPDEMCFPIRAVSGNIAVICL